MTNLVPINAGWALWGKHPGTHDDYSVLACSAGPFSRADFSAILSRFAPGTPSASAGGPGALPWVTISWVGVNDDLHLGIAVQTTTDQVDGVGRSITQTSYFCVPYARLAQEPISYTSLYEAVAPLQLPLDDGDPIPLTLPRLDPPVLADVVTEFGELAVATTAALVLRGPVSIIRAETSKLDERLRFIEAVAALLPYGYRTKYTAATWSDSGSRHRIRLAFAERPRDGAQPVTWREPGNVPADDPVLQGYLRQLGRLRGRIPSFAFAEPFELPAIIGHLAKDSQPQKFDQPKSAVDSLLDIDLPFAVLDMVHSGTAERASVRRLFSGSRVPELPPDGQRTVLEELIGYSDATDWPTIERWFGPIAADKPLAMLPVLARTAHGLLWTSSPSRAVRDHLALAAAHGLEDALLASIIRPPDDAASAQGGLAYAAQLLNDCVIANDGTGSHLATLEAMGGNPLVACELLAQVAGSDPGASQAIDWLAHAVPELLVPFDTVLTGSQRPIDQQAIRQLASLGRDCVRALLQAAARVNRLNLVLPAFLQWLSSRGELGSAEDRYWQILLRDLPLGDAGIRAGVDLALLTVNSWPGSLLTVAGQADWPVYASYFTSAWGALCVPGRCDAERLSATLGQYLAGQPWATDLVRARAVVELTRRLTQSGYRQELVGAVASSLSELPATARWPFVQDWLAEVERDHPGIVRDGALISLRGLRPGTPADRVVALCIRALYDGATADAAGRAVAESRSLNSETAAAVLQELRSALTAAGFAVRLTRDWLREFTAIFAYEYFDTKAGVEFRRQMRLIASGGILHDLDLLDMTARSGRTSLDLTDDERDSLERARSHIEKLLKSTRRTPPWAVLHRNMRQGNDGSVAGQDAGR